MRVPHHVRLIPLFLISVLSTIASAGEYTVITENLDLPSSLHCRAILREVKSPANAVALPLLVSLNGTGTYSMENLDELGPTPYTMLEEGLANVLTIDKPGIDFVDGKVVIREEEFHRFTQTDLVECTNAAVAWVASRSSQRANGEVYLQGHSEGAMVLSRVYERWIVEKRDTSVRMLLLSGVPMNPMKDILESQLSDDSEKRARFYAALESGDEETIQSITEGVNSRYWKEVFEAPPLSKILGEVADRSPEAALEIYQGLNDWNVSAKSVQDFEAENLQKKKAGKPHWFLDARYYNAGHGLNRAAMNDQITLLLAYLKH